MTDVEQAADLRVRVAQARARLRAAHDAGGEGRQVAAQWARDVDELLVPFVGRRAREQGLDGDALALFALGGYGRGELSPYSDLDLLVLHNGHPAVGAFLEAFLYPLWDAGLDVQCVARTPEENLAVARDDHRSRTSLLDGRCLWAAGGGGLLTERFDEELVRGELFGPGARAFVEAKIAELEARHLRYGGTVYLLEPNVKEGIGGLRDIQAALWVAKVRFRVTAISDLLRKRVIPRSELDALESSRDFLLWIRNDLHFAAGRREDHLTFDAQERIAAGLGLVDGDVPPGEQFLQRYYASANRVGHFAATVIRRASAGLLPRPDTEEKAPRQVLPGVTLRGGELHLRPDAVERAPLLLVEVFEAAQAHDADLSPEALEVLRENLHRVDDRFRRDPRAVQSFLRILRSPRRVATTLMRMHDVHFLDRFIPEFGHIFCRIQRDLYHVYPVDVHSLFAVQELRRFARGGDGDLPLLAQLTKDVRAPHVLYLAALLHDVGKGYGGGHERKGAEIAVDVAERMGLPPDERDRLVFLVANHLLFALTAQNRDLHDQELLLDFARKVGDLESLRMLYLLTCADIRAMGPGAWSNWKDLLFRELYEKASRVLERGTFEAEVAEGRVRDVGARLQEAARRWPSPPPEDETALFLASSDGAPYLLAYSLESLERHLQVFLRRGSRPAVAVRHVPAEGYSEVLLVVGDRPGLFADVAGLLAAHRLNVLSAALHTRSDGWTLDVFHVCGTDGEVVGDDTRWRAWEHELEAVLGGRPLLEVVGSSRPTPGGVRRWKPGVPVRVRLDNDASRRFTVVDITAGDRLGLLYDVARTFAERGLSIRLAKITTNLDQVSDSFYVEKPGEGKVTEPGEAGELEKALREVLLEGGGG